MLYAFASFGVILAMAEGAVSLFEHEICKAIERLRPPDAVFAHILVRFLPGVTALLLTCFSALPAYLNGEPNQTQERPGLWLTSLAAIGIFGLIVPLVRVGWMVLRTTLRTRSWTNSGMHTQTVARIPVFELALPNPVIVASGLRRKAIFVSVVVRSMLSTREFRAVLRHEVAHCRQNHNLAKLVCTMAPRLLSAEVMDRSLREVIEYAADDDVCCVPGDALNLASALVTLAKEVVSVPRAVLQTPFTNSMAIESAILERRVRRLVLPVPSETHEKFIRMVCACASMVGFVAFLGTFPVVQNAFRETLEFLIR